ncbi:MAG: AAA family ATPase [Patescibacteria group bacterium]
MITDGPLLDKVKIAFQEGLDFSLYPFSLGIIKNLTDIVFPTQVTFFVGENGTGKSTILETIAHKAGFGPEGGSKNINFNTTEETHSSPIDLLSSQIVLSWRKKPKDGYFFRAESFFNLASHIDTIAVEGGQGRHVAYASYGGKSLHEQSHGESFLNFFRNRLGGGGFYIFDEPEAALSPQRQLALLKIIHDLSRNPETQFIIATHSPILLAYPNARIYSCDSDTLETIQYKDTKHYQITKGFLDNPDQYFTHLFND